MCGPLPLGCLPLARCSNPMDMCMCVEAVSQLPLLCFVGALVLWVVRVLVRACAGAVGGC